MRPRTTNTKKIKKCQRTAIWQNTRKHPKKFILMPYESFKIWFPSRHQKKTLSYHVTLEESVALKKQRTG